MFGLPHYKGLIDKILHASDSVGHQPPHGSRSGSSEMCVPFPGICNDI